MAKTIYRNEYRQLVDLLRERREASGVSQLDLARSIGWRQQKLSLIETGARRMDVLEYIALARALGLTPTGALRQAERLLQTLSGRRRAQAAD